MPDIDTLLQENLELLEKGTPLAEVLAGLPAEAVELRMLIEMAAAVQTAPHPEFPESRRLARQRQLVAAGRYYRTVDTAPAPFWRGGLLGTFSAAKILGLLLLVGALFIGMNLWVAGPPAARAAELIEFSGTVEVASQDEPQMWQLADEGAKLQSGMLLRTGSQASAKLAYFDGSWTQLGPDTEIILTRVDGRWWNTLQVELAQPNGQTTHFVMPFRDRQGGFVVSTPAGDTRVQGTRFQITVLENNEVRVNAVAGRVEVGNQAGSVELNSGMVGNLAVGNAPEVLGYPFLLQDHLTAVLGRALIVADIPVNVDQRTILDWTPMLGEVITVQGYVRPNGLWVAERVSPQITVQKGAADFIGALESMNSDLWQVGGETVVVNEATDIQRDLSPGMIVRVEFVVLDGGRWLAMNIRELDDEDEQESEGDTLLDLPEPARNCTDGGGETHPQGFELSQRYAVSYDAIMGWFCQGFGFGEIDLVYSLSLESGLPVEQIFLMKEIGPGWGNVLGSIPLTATQTSTTTLPIEFEPNGIEVDSKFECSNTDIHPTGQKLAVRYGVPPEEIMGRFCQGYGFGEIDLAYSLSHDSGEAPEQIFEEKQNGKGWGEIKQELEDEKKPQDKGPEKNKHPDKP